MATVVLSAASAELPALQALAGVLDDELRGVGETDVRRFDLAATPLAYCQGEFDCWVKTPGVCRAHDAEADIVRAIHDADRVVMLDAVTFGGHSYTMKRAQDRLICLISPFFEKRASLTHHEGSLRPMWVRFVLVPGLTDDVDDIKRIARYAAEFRNVQRVDVLPFRQLGRYKWEALGIQYTLEQTEPPTPESVEEVCRLFKAEGLPAY